MQQLDTKSNLRVAAVPASAASSPRFTNFDLLRLLAAISVIFSHSFAIVNGNEKAEPLVMLLGDGNILGLYGVYTFFIISGFLITASFEKSSILRFAMKRCLRIYPGLIACTVATTGIALFASTKGVPPLGIIQNGLQYVAETLLFFDSSDSHLPGVIFSSNDYGAIFNGSLWSLGPEFLCYVAVAALGICGVLGLRAALIGLAFGLYTHHSGILGNIGFVLPFFAAGAVLHFWLTRWSLRGCSVVWSVVGLLTGALLGFPSLSFALFGSCLLIKFATGRFQISGSTRFGDLSYGMYLYGWPVEQSLRFLFGDGATWWLVFLFAVPTAGVLAMTSWYLVEKQALRLVDRSPRQSLDRLREAADPRQVGPDDKPLVLR